MELFYYKKVKNPIQYLGIDINIPDKNWNKSDVKILLAFPDLYEIGSSNLGIQILYHIVNSKNNYLCDRIFAPDLDMMQFIKYGNIKYYSLDFKKPPLEFDLIAFSMQYELNFSTMLTMLELMGVPIFAKDRIEENNIPIICAGGPAVYNPLPLTKFFDFFLIGDGEEVIIEKCKIFKDFKNSSKIKKLEELNNLTGVYSPFFKKEKIQKRIITHFKDEYIPLKPIIPSAKTVHERVAVEVARGCTRGCRFCQAGMVYRPVREKNLNDILNISEKSLRNTGYEELSTLSLSVGDYSKLNEMIENLKELNCSISIPSIRADKINNQFLEFLSERERTGFTIAPEAGSENLRKAINKNLSNEEILTATEFLYKNGWSLIKLYFMIGLPYETYEDIYEIVNLSKNIMKIGKKVSKRNRLNVSISPFVPKAHTPFQWFGQNGFSEIVEKINYLRDSFRKIRGIKLKTHNPKMSLLEAVFSRGDENIGDLLVEAYKNGAYLDGWSDKFDFKKWEQASATLKIDLHKKAEKEYLPNDNLPWDFIDIGVNWEFLTEELHKSKNRIETADCRRTKCHNCGVCKDNLKNIFSDDNGNINQISKQPFLQYDDFKRWIFKYSKKDIAALLGQIDTNKIIIRALKRTDKTFKYTEGFKPKLKISFSPPPPFGVETTEEFFEIYLHKNDNPDDILNVINDFLPDDLVIEDYFENREKLKLVNDAKSATYSIYLTDIPEMENEMIQSIEKFENFTKIVILYKNGKHLNIKKALTTAMPEDFDIETIKIVRTSLNY